MVEFELAPDVGQESQRALKAPRDPFEAEMAVDGLPRKSNSMEDWRLELASYLAEMQKFDGMDTTEVFLRLSAFSARAAEIRFSITGGESRRMHAFRTQGVDPFVEECDRQFKLHSRIQAIREMEFRISGGGV